MLKKDQFNHPLIGDNRTIWTISIGHSTNDAPIHTFEILVNDNHSIMSLFQLIEKTIQEDNRKRFWEELNAN